jgi:hypothetical protein
MEDNYSSPTHSKGSVQDMAEAIIREADARAASRASNRDALHDAEGGSERKSKSTSYLGMSRDRTDQEELIHPSSPVKQKEIEESRPSPLETRVNNDERTELAREDMSEDVFVSSKLGVPLLSDDPAPFSRLLHLPVLLSDKKEVDQK